MEMQSGGKQTQKTVWKERDPVGTKRVKKKTPNPRYRTTNPYDIWLWKPERPNFTSSYNEQSLTPQTLELADAALGELGGQKENEIPPLKKTMNSPVEIEYRSSSLKNIWEIGNEICLLTSEHVLEGQGSLGDFSRNKGAGKHHSSPLSPNLDPYTPAETRTTPTHAT